MQTISNRGGLIVTTMAVAAMVFTAALPAASVAVAAPAPDPILDVEADVATVALGSTVTLTATIFETDGTTVMTGPGSNTQVRFFFLAGSANDPGGSGADLQCHTGQSGSCTVSYVATIAGTDTLCAKTSNGPSACTEPVGDQERTNETDSVMRTITPSASPSPNTSPSPTASPTASPSASATASPSASPSDSPTASPSPSASPSDSPSASPSDSPTASPSATASPSDSPTASPSATASPSPSQSAEASDAPTSAPTTSPTASPTEAPSQAPGSNATSAPTEAPSAEPSALVAFVPPGGSSDGGTSTGGTGTGGTDTGRAGSDSHAGPLVEKRPTGIVGMVEALVGAAADGAGKMIRPEAAVVVATALGFPIVLALMVLMFLLLQPRLDKRDPKLRNAPRTLADTLVAFEDDIR